MLETDVRGAKVIANFSTGPHECEIKGVKDKTV